MTTDNDDVTYRPATHDDYADVVAFTEDTWADLDVEASDYLPEVYNDWIEGEDQRVLVADAGDAIAGIAKLVMLSEYEAWAEGMRVNPAFRGKGIGTGINEALFGWGREQGAVVARNMVFSWNQAGLGQSRAIGYEPVTEFRWLQPEPDPTRSPPEAGDPDAAFAFWSASEARERLAGLALDMDNSWSLRDLTRETLARAATETALVTVTGESGTRAMSYRNRSFDRETADGETERWAEYGVAAWADVDAARELLALIGADAAAIGAERTRVLIPETARFVSDGAFLRGNISEEPDFVLAADLTER